jgi:protein involved in plasmid replication-relaxation
MTLNDGPRMVLQERDRHLLRELAVMRVIDREQAKVVAGFGSTTRVNARLLLLVAAGLLRRFFIGTNAGGAKALYSLAEKGARLVDVPFRGFRRTSGQALVGDFFVQHQLAVNEVYCALKHGVPPTSKVTFKRWVTFQEPVSPGLRLIPDGYVEFLTPSETVSAFLEVDLGHERLKVWKDKVQNYFQLALSGTFERQFGQRRFRVLVIANSPGRMLSIRKVAAPVTDRIFWFSDFAAVKREGIFGPIWVRPRSDQPQPLFRETQ